MHYICDSYSAVKQQKIDFLLYNISTAAEGYDIYLTVNIKQLSNIKAIKISPLSFGTGSCLWYQQGRE